MVIEEQIHEQLRVVYIGRQRRGKIRYYIQLVRNMIETYGYLFSVFMPLIDPYSSPAVQLCLPPLLVSYFWVFLGFSARVSSRKEDKRRQPHKGEPKGGARTRPAGITYLPVLLTFRAAATDLRSIMHLVRRPLKRLSARRTTNLRRIFCERTPRASSVSLNNGIRMWRQLR